eukprot:10748074-Prorocentrum_lima.AAC.1
MTSSLVGSEMCIRDRHGVGIPGRPLFKARKTGNQGSWRNKGGSQKLSSVSYTHLTLPTICSV